MKKHIEKLLKEYSEKINTIENVLITPLQRQITAQRREGTDHTESSMLMKELNAILMAYQQAKADIDSLLDYCDDNS